MAAPAKRKPKAKAKPSDKAKAKPSDKAKARGKAKPADRTTPKDNAKPNGGARASDPARPGQAKSTSKAAAAQPSDRRSASVDAYLAKLEDDKRAALEALRDTIHAAIPDAEECMSYQLPAFRLDGRLVVWFGAAANHCALYPGGGVMTSFAEELAGFQTSKGTIRFQPDQPLPKPLVKKLVQARVAANAALPPSLYPRSG